jgi:hypothetical protein
VVVEMSRPSLECSDRVRDASFDVFQDFAEMSGKMVNDTTELSALALDFAHGIGCFHETVVNGANIAINVTYLRIMFYQPPRMHLTI